MPAMPSQTATILIVDDEPDITALLSTILQDEGYTTLTAHTAHEAFQAIETHLPDLVILDIWLDNSEFDGLDILKHVKDENPLLPMIMMSGHGTINTAVSALQQGAYDFIEKPFKTDRLLIIVKRAIEALHLRQENEKLRAHNTPARLQLLETSPTLMELQKTLQRIARTNSRVMVQGEAGAGKTAAARYIHDQSARAGKPFTVLNCATLSPDRFEIELFGAEKGVAGPYKTTGLLQHSDGGTLLLDEIADMPPTTQAKILKVLQNNRFYRVGGQELIEVDVRFIATTHQDLLEAIEQHRFREDLYYRLNVAPISLPPLRAFNRDIPAFIDLFTRQICDHSHLIPVPFSYAVIDRMTHYHWPGNVRQLRNTIEWLMIVSADSSEVTLAHLPPELGMSSSGTVPLDSPLLDSLLSLPLREARHAFEHSYISRQVDRFDGNISKTADFIGMQRSALHRKIKQLQLSTKNATLGQGTIQDK